MLLAGINIHELKCPEEIFRVNQKLIAVAVELNHQIQFNVRIIREKAHKIFFVK